jgi:hypothetical protein
VIQDESAFEGWDLEEESFEPVAPRPWRRRLIISVAALTAFAMAAVPLYNLIDTNPPIADNGLAVCGFDYCIVQEGMRRAGADGSMNLLANTYLTDAEAERLASTLVTHLGQAPLRFVIVDRLDGQLKGQYDPSTRTIVVERPASAWIVIHEVAHAMSSGHGENFQAVLVGLTRWLDMEATAYSSSKI